MPPPFFFITHHVIGLPRLRPTTLTRGDALDWRDVYAHLSEGGIDDLVHNRDEQHNEERIKV
jgi:hypothetical protein